jgi:REP element-mobilizing transposase RayT
MFPPNPLIKLLLEKSLAQAQALHPVCICHLTFETTHVHMLLVVDNPDDVKGFMERFKTESSHAINRLLGREKHTIWCEGYDSPTVLDVPKVLDTIAYIYENPAKDGLVDSINHYPGVCSWKHFRAGKTSFPTCFVPRDAIRALPNRLLSLYEYRREARLLTHGRKAVTFKISPDAWMKVFEITDPQERRKLNESIIQEVAQREAVHRQLRTAAGKQVIGAARLQEQPIGRAFTPEREGQKMICLASDKELRIPFIQAVKDLIEEGKEVLAEWRRGNFTIPYPLGLYPPSLPKRAEVLALQ